MKLAYLAVPYSHSDPLVRETRFNVANKAASYLMNMRLAVFSPISHTHPIAIIGGLPIDWSFWVAYDRKMLSMCDMLIVLTIKGWHESVGVSNEIEIAREMSIPIRSLSALMFLSDINLI